MSVNLNTELGLVNTSANPGTINLPPAASIVGRVLTFKDSSQKFGTNVLTLQCDGGDTFEDGAATKILRENNGIIQIVASGTTWYVLTGTQQNSVSVSTLQALNICTTSISTGNYLVSSLQYDKVVPLYQQSSLTYFNNNVFAGSRVYPATNLNTSQFTPASIPGLALWFDASDMNTVITNGSNITQLLDKSEIENNTRVLSANFPTISSFGSVILSSIAFNGNTQLTIPKNFSYENRNEPYMLAVVCKPNMLRSSVSSRSGITGANSRYGYSPALGFFYTTPGNSGVLQFTNSFGATRNLSTFSNFSNVRMAISQKLNYITAPNCYENGFSFGTVGNANSNNDNTNDWEIGRAAVLGNYFGEIGEILYYNKTFTTNNDRQMLEGYLAWKWGTVSYLPQNHPYKNAPP